MSKSFWAVIAVIVVIFGGILLLNGHKNSPGSSSNAKPTSHIEGKGATGVTLIEYGDYQCPYCGEFYPFVKQVAAKYNDQIYFQFRNLPLIQVHQNALAAARAAEAASNQGKFWEMHDLLYENQSAWAEGGSPQATFDRFATQLGLNVAQFDKDAASAATNDIINADLAAFDKTGAEKSTPAFFVDGKLVNPKAISADALSVFIDQAIAAKKKS
ncbi:MAG TPA: thioredoxin domain-containing protein [Candidatus Saccharimonadales bacterium]|nr:thioredoxin domain-containing protein [Candidatus Saccharimonadales bacterium]